MTVQRLEHIGIVVDDLAAATAFFAALGLELEGEASVEGGSVDRINGLEGVRADIVMLRTPDGNGKVELAKYRSPLYEGEDGPAPANAPGIRHILFVVDDIEASLAGVRAHGGELVGELVNYENSYRLGYVRGPAGIIVELAEKISIIVLGIACGVAFGTLNTFGIGGAMITLAMIFVYGCGLVAVPILYRREHPDEFKWLRHLLLPAIGVVSLAPVFWYSISPFPPYPIKIAPIAAIIWFVVGIGLVVWLSRTRPGRLEASAKQIFEDPAPAPR